MACAALLETTKQITYQWIPLKRQKNITKQVKKSPHLRPCTTLT